MEQPMARVARLDAERLFMGLGDPVPIDEVKAGDFVFGDPALKALLPEGATWIERDCDLPPGRYRLTEPHDDHPHWHFMPLTDALIHDTENLIELGLAMALANWSAPGPIGRYAQQYYGLVSKNFPEIMQRHAAKGPSK